MPQEPKNLQETFTPALVLDRTRMRRNVSKMNESLGDTMLRPHLKTSKSVDVALETTRGRKSGVTVSTLKEAEYFYQNGFSDILYAVGMIPDKVERVVPMLLAGAELTFVADDLMNVRELGNAAKSAGVVLKLMIEIDTDGHRSGLRPDDARVAEMSQLINAHPSLEFRGVMTHAGESYGLHDPKALAEIAEVERAGAVKAANSIRSAGVACPVVSGGSTPTALSASSREGLTEVRAGVFVFQDLVQSNIGICSVDDIAISVLTTVIGHQRERNWLITDAGGMALSKDRGTASQKIDYGYGLVTPIEDSKPIPGLKVTAANQEHGIISSDNTSIPWDRFPIGTRLRVLPNHACMTAAAHDHYCVVDSGSTKILSVWDRINGW